MIGRSQGGGTAKRTATSTSAAWAARSSRRTEPAATQEAPGPGCLFSLRTIVRDDAGAEMNRIEVTRIEETPLDPSLFLVPAGCRKVTPEGLQR
jgi:hypothetical protein